MPWKLPYPQIAPVPATDTQQNGWLRDVIMGAQMPHFVSTGANSGAWANMDLPGLVKKLGPSTRVNMMVTPDGVVGYYNTGLVHVSLRDGKIWGRATVPRLQPQQEIALPHVQVEGALGVFAEHLAKPTREPFITPAERVYLRTCDSILPQVADVMARGIPTDAATLEGVSVYLSQAGTVTNLHWDLRSGAIQQLRGRKRVVMFPPAAINVLPMHPVDHIFVRRCVIDGQLDEAAFAAFDVLNHVPGAVCDLGPGDWLYLPAGWSHHVTTCDDDCISLIINFLR